MWRIKLVPPHHYILKRTDSNKYTIGSCDNMTKTIYINCFLPKNKIWKVLCHEIAHALFFSYNIDLTIEQEETMADLIATYGNEIIEITNEVFKKILEGE